MKIGVITYDCLHLKTEQVVINFNNNPKISEINLYALPFEKRIDRQVLIQHRPDQSKSIASESLSELNKVNFFRWDGENIINGNNEYFVITGAGIIDVSKMKGVPIINAHPGIIPIQRGLDAFKWTIYDGNVLGNTLHFIDKEVDAGEVIVTVKTELFSGDSLETLARRHYENEILMLSNFLYYIENGGWISMDEQQNSRMRMPIEAERTMVRRFDQWKERLCE